MKTNEESKQLLSHPRPVYPWVIWILCNLFNFFMFLLQFSAWDLRSSLLSKNLLLEADKGTLLDPFLIAIILFQIPVALLLDEFGPRKVTSLMILLTSFGVILFAASTSAFLIWISIFVMGLGGTVTYVNTFKLVSNWFLPSRFPFMVAWTVVASIIGAIIGQPLTLMLAKKFGWTNVLFNYGMVGILLAVIFFLCIRDRNYHIVPKPELFRLGASVKKLFKSPHSYLIALAYGLATAPWVAFTGRWHTPFFRVVYHFTQEQAAFINLIDFAAFAAGALLFAYFGKKLDKRKVLMGAGISGTLFLICLIFYVPRLGFGSIVILSSLASFFMSSATLSYSLMRESNLIAITATSIAMMTFFLAIFRFIFDHLTTFALQASSSLSIEKIFEYSSGDLQLGLSLLPLALLLSLICIIFIKDTYGKQQYGE